MNNITFNMLQNISASKKKYWNVSYTEYLKQIKKRFHFLAMGNT